MTDGVQAIANFTGLARADTLSIMQEVKANQARLNSCSSHDFVDATPLEMIRKKYRCERCAGTVDGSAFHWYSRGRAHESGK